MFREEFSSGYVCSSFKEMDMIFNIARTFNLKDTVGILHKGLQETTVFREIIARE